MYIFLHSFPHLVKLILFRLVKPLCMYCIAESTTGLFGCVHCDVLYPWLCCQSVFAVMYCMCVHCEVVLPPLVLLGSRSWSKLGGLPLHPPSPHLCSRRQTDQDVENEWCVCVCVCVCVCGGWIGTGIVCRHELTLSPLLPSYDGMDSASLQKIISRLLFEGSST